MPAAAARARGRRQRPPAVTLRDFLELGCESSTSDGFRSYPRRADDVQNPAEKKKKAAELSRSPSWSPSAFLFPKSPGALSRISRSLSRRISFVWRRRRDEYDDILLDDDRDSCGFPSPLVSSCSCSSSASASDVESSEQDIVIEVASASSAPASEREEASAAGHDCSVDDAPPGAAAGDDRHHEDEDEAAVVDGDDEGPPVVGRGNKLETMMMEDKQQLSPVSVLDFPFDDDDGGDEEEGSNAGTYSCSFSSSSCCFVHHHHNYCAAAANNNLQGTKKKTTQHDIRRLDDGPTTIDYEAAAEDNLEAAPAPASSVSGEEESVDDDNRCASTSSCSTDGDDSTNTTAPRHDSEEEERCQSGDEPRPQSQCAEKEPAVVDECRLFARLLDDDSDDAAASNYSAAAVDEVTEWLLLDFFAEGIARLRSLSVAGPVLATTTSKPLDDGKVAAALLDAAAKWLRGAGPRWGIGDVVFSGESALQDMERGRPGWSCVREQKQEVASEAEELVTDWLMDELVTELCSGCC